MLLNLINISSNLVAQKSGKKDAEGGKKKRSFGLGT